MEERRGPGYVIYAMLFRFFDHVVLGRAAELAYYFLFSLTPLIIFGTSLIAMLHFDVSNFSHLVQMLPAEVLQIISSLYQFIQDGSSTGMAITGLLLSIYFSSAAIRSLMRSLDTAYGVKKGRNPIFQFILSFFFAIIFLATMIASFILMVVGGAIVDLILQFFPNLQDFSWLVNFLRFAVMILPLIGIFVLLYTFTPHRKLTVRSSLPGALFAMLAWIFVSMLFSFYVTNYGQYATLYGSLGTIIVLMLWFYLTGAIFILGGELNAVLLERKQHRTQQQLLADGAPEESVEPSDFD